MTYSLATSDAFPYVCGVYTCQCGRKSMRHGRLAAVLPPGWVEWQRDAGETTHACDVCAARASGKAIPSISR